MFSVEVKSAVAFTVIVGFVEADSDILIVLIGDDIIIIIMISRVFAFFVVRRILETVAAVMLFFLSHRRPGSKIDLALL